MSQHVCRILPIVFALILTLSGPASLLALDATPPADAPYEMPSYNFTLFPKGQYDGSYFTVEAAAGETVELTAVLGNAGTEPAEVRTYASDVVQLVNGGFGVKEASGPITEPTTWLNWESTTHMFEPGMGIEQLFTVSVPEDARPGQYLSALSIENVEPISVGEGEGSAFNQIIRKSVAVFIIVEGDTTAGFTLSQPDLVTTSAGSYLDFPIVNTGDVLVRPEGSLTLTDTETGRVVLSVDVILDSIYAHNNTSVQIRLDDSLAGREYDIELELADEETGTDARVQAEAVFFDGEVPDEVFVSITEQSLEPMPDANDPLYAAVDLTITNEDLVMERVNVILRVYHDGEFVEEFPVSTNLTLEQGDNEISQRYIPAEGFLAGEWTFEIELEVMDPVLGTTTVLITEPIEDSIVVGSN